MGDLKHAGVKGMKWGVRKEEAARNVDAYRQGIVERHTYSTKAISKAEYNSMSKTPVKIADRDSSLYRVAGKAGRGTVNDITYVTKDKRDNDKYVALLAPAGKMGPKFQQSLSSNKELVSPSKRERIETLVSTLDKNVPGPYNRSVVKGRDYLMLDPVDKALSDFDLGLKYYNQFAQNQVLRTPLHTEYFNAVKEKGYSALVDDADAGIVSKTPVIVFNGLNTLKVNSSNRLSDLEIEDAQLRLLEEDI